MTRLSVVTSCLLLIAMVTGGSIGQEVEVPAQRRSDDPQGWEVMVQTLSDRVNQLEAEVQALRQALRTSAPVSFLVQFKEYHHHFAGDNVILQFDDVVSNQGNGYNANTGHFTAPAAGTYEFHLNLLSDHDHGVWQNLCVVVNTACVALTQLADSAALSVVLQLQQGDAVSVLKRDGPGSSIYGINHTTFSGVLVSPAQ